MAENQGQSVGHTDASGAAISTCWGPGASALKIKKLKTHFIGIYRPQGSWQVPCLSIISLREFSEKKPLFYPWPLVGPHLGSESETTLLVSFWNVRSTVTQWSMCSASLVTQELQTKTTKTTTFTRINEMQKTANINTKPCWCRASETLYIVGWKTVWLLRQILRFSNSTSRYVLNSKT